MQDRISDWPSCLNMCDIFKRHSAKIKIKS
jgi:hypothetical protein